ncbi:MAG: hypothetical protein GY856_11665 [bacterium]|nr:hypothetical protein [bacterium]
MRSLVKNRSGLPALVLGGAFLVHLLARLTSPAPVAGGVFVFTSFSSDPPDRVVHVAGYDGSGGTLALGICIAPGSPFVAEMQIPIENAIRVFNGLQPTAGNVVEGDANNVPADALDFETFLVATMARCFGLDDPKDNLGYTPAQWGSNDSLDRNPGADLIPGTGDDLRSDDVNVHWYRLANNNPFTIDDPVDSTTYSVDTLLLPGSDTFVANANANVAVAYGFPNTEAVPYYWLPADYARRTLAPDDVATLRYGMSGIDELAATADDYVFQLEYQGISDSCDIVLGFEPSSSPVVYGRSAVPVMGLSDHYRMLPCRFYFGSLVNWYFNIAPPCSTSNSLVADQWRMISLPCDTGSNDTVQEVFGNDLESADYGMRWGIFERDELVQVYRMLELTDPLNEGVGYWITTLDPGQSITVDGAPNEVVDVPLVAAADGRQNLVGHPFDVDVCWADAQVVDGASVLTLHEADPVIGPMRACAMEPPDPSCVMSRVAYKWTGAAYEVFDGETPAMQGTLEPFDGLWVKAFKPGVTLRIPAQPAVDCTLCSPQPVADAGPDQSICPGDSVTLGTPAEPGHVYEWSPGGETTAQIDATPLVTTTYTVTASTACGSAQDSVDVTVLTSGDALDEDFEGDVSGWTATGLWHLTDDSGCAAPAPGYASPTKAFYYGQDVTCTYSTGAANSGELTSPPIAGITADSALSLQYLREAEQSVNYDKTEVIVVTQSGSTTVLTIATNATTWTSISPISLAGFAGESIRIRFRFDTVDSYANGYMGWFIDDVVVTGNACLKNKKNDAASSSRHDVPSSRPETGPRSWSVRLIVESGDLRDSANVLGQLPGAADGYDYHDLAEPAPFSRRYLSVVFPHDDWGDYAADYSSDFRAPDSPLGTAWRFDVIGAGFDQAVTLRWEAQGIPLRGWWLVDEETGERIRAEPGGSHTFTMTGSRRSFRWRKNE